MIAPDSKLDGVAVVTGAAVRIGRAVALALAQQGADIVLHYGHSNDAAEETAEQIRHLGRQALTVSADLSQPLSGVKSVFNAAKKLGPCNILVNSAAIFENARLVETAEELFDRHLQINLKAPYFLCQEFVRQLGADRQGQILNFVDWRAETPPADYAAYTVSKAGLLALTKTLALQLAPRIRVNAIAPGAILPPPGGHFDQWQQEKLPDIPLARTGDTDDIVDAALYLIRSKFVTGEILHVTGGEHL